MLEFPSIKHEQRWWDINTFWIMKDEKSLLKIHVKRENRKNNNNSNNKNTNP